MKKYLNNLNLFSGEQNISTNFKISCPYKNVREIVKILKQADFTNKSIAQFLNLKHSTLSHLIYQINKNIPNVCLFENLLENNCVMALNEIKDKITSHFKLNSKFSLKELSNIIHQLQFTFKKGVKSTLNRNNPTYIEKRYDVAKK